MPIADSFLGKEGRVLSQFINNARIAAAVEISSSSETSKKLDEIKKAISKQPGTYTIIAFKN